MSKLVLDLRGNRGGIAAMAMGLAGWFVEEPNAYLGTMYMRTAELRMVVNPRAGAYDGPVAVLVDAFVVRLTLVPALMTVTGRANWWTPTRRRRRPADDIIELRAQIDLRDTRPADEPTGDLSRRG